MGKKGKKISGEAMDAILEDVLSGLDMEDVCLVAGYMTGAVVVMDGGGGYRAYSGDGYGGAFGVLPPVPTVPMVAEIDTWSKEGGHYSFFIDVDVPALPAAAACDFYSEFERVTKAAKKKILAEGRDIENKLWAVVHYRVRDGRDE